MNERITPADIVAMKQRGQKIPSLTAYDYPMTRLLDEAGVPLILVGDSLGMVVLGYPDTTHVTMDEMVHHVRAAARAKPRALLAADLPFESYSTPEIAVANARRLVEAGAVAVKAEGGRSIAPQVKAIRAAGIAFFGHLGMLPQHVLEEGGEWAAEVQLPGDSGHLAPNPGNLAQAELVDRLRIKLLRGFARDHQPIQFAPTPHCREADFGAGLGQVVLGQKPPEFAVGGAHALVDHGGVIVRYRVHSQSVIGVVSGLVLPACL